jgi:hypothetical protein
LNLSGHVFGRLGHLKSFVMAYYFQFSSCSSLIGFVCLPIEKTGLETRFATSQIDPRSGSCPTAVPPTRRFGSAVPLCCRSGSWPTAVPPPHRFEPVAPLCCSSGSWPSPLPHRFGPAAAARSHPAGPATAGGVGLEVTHQREGLRLPPAWNRQRGFLAS